jgi:2-polyprenyl-3-methyl-5-hydroxy-6-metoxy-1,4-benzoquinol methylase
MKTSNTDEVEQTLQKPEVHRQWEEVYRSAENEAFYELAFDKIAACLNAPPDAMILDVGCGSCTHSMRLARRGFTVLAVDFSEPVLEAAQQNLIIHGMVERIKLEPQNVLALTYPEQNFDFILCWGVLMHIPEVETAITELDRVLRKGGRLVLAENNMHSVQAILRRSFKLLHHKSSTEMKRTASGLEWWTMTSTGKLLTRYADIGWMKNEFSRRGYRVQENFASQFSEFYTKAPTSGLKLLVHAWNAWWFKNVNSPRLAFGNILIVEKVR